MQTLTMTVTGMSCGGCSGRIERELVTLDGVQKVDAFHDQDRASFHFDPQVVDRDQLSDQIATQVEKMGFAAEPDG